MGVAVPSDCAYTWSIEMPTLTPGFVPWRHVVMAGGPQPCEPVGLQVGVLSTLTSTSTLSLTGASGINDGLSAYPGPKVFGSQLGCHTPQPMCQLTQRMGGLACASARVGRNSESSAGRATAAATPRKMARRLARGGVGRCRSLARALSSKETLSSVMLAKLMTQLRRI